MSTIRHAVPAIMLTALAVQPALAETCNVTVNGRPVVDDEPCTSTSRGGVLTIEQGNIVTAVVRRSVLMANFAEDATSRLPKRYRLRSFGLVVKSDSNDDKVCYFNQRITLCIER